METTVKNPLVIHCKFCGGDQSYDIVKQKYCCAHCGYEADIAEKKTEYRNWKSLRQKAVMQDIGDIKAFSCPSCGAQTIANAENATAECPFCQSTMIDTAFAGNDIPEVILPFKLTNEEAKAKLKEWLQQHKSDPAAQAIEKNMHRFTGCYLPYHIVRGAYNGKLHINLHNGGATNGYPFRAYLSHTAVNASKDLDNLFLDGIEPFDFNDAREFNFRYLIHQNAKIQNVDNETLRNRINEETQAELFESFSQKVHTKEMSVLLNDDGEESIPALMPVYLVKCKNGVAAAVNGQTEKISIATGKTKNLTKFWWLAPTIATLIVGLAGGLFGGLQLGFMGALVFGIVFFAIAHNRHSDKIVNQIITHPKTDKTHNDTRTEFFADFGQGPVPAKLKFFTPWRIIKTILIILAVIFLPVLIAIPIQLLRGMPISDIQIGYGAAWYCLPGFFTILAAGGLAKSMMYGVPLYYEILPNGKIKRRKLPSQNAPSLKEILANTKFVMSTKVGCFLIGSLVLLLVGSVAAMVS